MVLLSPYGYDEVATLLPFMHSPLPELSTSFPFTSEEGGKDERTSVG